MRIAIIGTGIAGNAAAYALATSTSHRLTVYERDSRLGGHSATVDIDYDGTPIAVDTGFIVYNEMNYPNLTALFAHLGIETQASEMSFALSARKGGFEWCGRTYDVARRPVRAAQQPALARLPLRCSSRFCASTGRRGRGSRGRRPGWRLARQLPRLCAAFPTGSGTTISSPWARRSGRCRRSRCSPSPPRASSRSSRTTTCCNGTGRSGVRSRAAAGAMSRRMAESYRRPRQARRCMSRSVERSATGVVVTDETGETSSLRPGDHRVAFGSERSPCWPTRPAGRDGCARRRSAIATTSVYLHRDTSA